VEKICEDPAAAPVLRVARSGERMMVTGVMEDMDNRYYYRVTDDGKDAYIDATNTELVCTDYEAVTVEQLKVPEALKKGGQFTVQGNLIAENCKVDAVNAFVYDEMGECAQQYKSSNLKKIKMHMNTAALAEGCYELEITASVQNHYVSEGALCAQEEVMVLYSGGFTVGQAELAEVAPVQARAAQDLDGWYLQDGVWYCYNNGQPRTGWFCDLGIDYYLNEDGSVTTGWQNIGGKDRYFSQTGALRIGWISRDDSTFYMLKNGVAAEGWYNVDGKNYYFDVNGLVSTEGWLQTEKGLAYLCSDGYALTGWNTVDDNRYFFDAAGMLFSQMQTVDGQSVLVLLENDPSIAPVM
jgi:glucan-binding YG repeat protein